MYLVLLCAGCLGPVFGELISTSVGVASAVVVSSFFAGYEYFKCKWYECCDNEWIPADITGRYNTATMRMSE